MVSPISIISNFTINADVVVVKPMGSSSAHCQDVVMYGAM